MITRRSPAQLFHHLYLIYEPILTITDYILITLHAYMIRCVVSPSLSLMVVTCHICMYTDDQHTDRRPPAGGGGSRRNRKNKRRGGGAATGGGDSHQQNNCPATQQQQQQNTNNNSTTQSAPPPQQHRQQQRNATSSNARCVVIFNIQMHVKTSDLINMY